METPLQLLTKLGFGGGDQGASLVRAMQSRPQEERSSVPSQIGNFAKEHLNPFDNGSFVGSSLFGPFVQASDDWARYQRMGTQSFLNPLGEEGKNIFSNPEMLKPLGSALGNNFLGALNLVTLGGAAKLKAGAAALKGSPAAAKTLFPVLERTTGIPSMLNRSWSAIKSPFVRATTGLDSAAAAAAEHGGWIGKKLVAPAISSTGKITTGAGATLAWMAPYQVQDALIRSRDNGIEQGRQMIQDVVRSTSSPQRSVAELTGKNFIPASETMVDRFMPDHGVVSPRTVRDFETNGQSSSFGENLKRFGGKDTAILADHGYIGKPIASQARAVANETGKDQPVTLGQTLDKYKYPLLAAGGLAAGAGILSWYNNKKQREAEERDREAFQYRRLMPRRLNMA